MPDYNDYRFDAQPGMRVDTWRALKPWLTRVTPGPLAHPVLASPTSDLSAPSAMVPAEFWWLAQTFGYGHPAMCYVNWCLKAGLGLTSAQKAALRRMARARAVMLHRVLFEMPGPPLALHARDIYPLIEPSEKAGVSYLLGGAMAMKVAPLAITARGNPALGRLYHTSLFKAHAMGGWGLSTIPTNCTPDFVAFDVAGRIHLIESKGTLGKFDYRGAASGLGQAVRLQAFNFSGMRVAPATRNVCATYFRSCAAPPGGAGEAVRTCVLHYPEVAGGGDIVPANHPIRIRLAGLYALGAWASLQALAQQQHEQGAWHIFAIPAIPGVDENNEINGWHIRVGLSAHLNDMMNQFNQDVIRSNAPLPTAQFEAAVQNIGHAVLALDHPPDDQPTVPPPEGMDPVSGDSWICIGKA